MQDDCIQCKIIPIRYLIQLHLLFISGIHIPLYIIKVKQTSIPIEVVNDNNFEEMIIFSFEVTFTSKRTLAGRIIFSKIT